MTTEPTTPDTSPTYRYERRVPRKVLSACLYALGMQQWLSPNADIEYAYEATSISQGLYAAVLINHGQYDQSNEYHNEPDWSRLRPFREHIFENHFYVPQLFHLTDFETPDEMFDAVETELVAHDLLNAVPEDRETEYVTVEYSADTPTGE